MRRIRDSQDDMSDTSNKWNKKYIVPLADNSVCLLNELDMLLLHLTVGVCGMIMQFAHSLMIDNMFHIIKIDYDADCNVI